MQRISITLDEDLIARFETFLQQQGYRNRSEAFRDLLRERLARTELEENSEGDCFATLTYVYDHHKRDLAARMTEASHAHHDLSVATLHVHLDHDHCLEASVLRGSMARVQAFAERIMAEPGVRHGALSRIPVKSSAQVHAHGEADQPHAHVHLEPLG